MAEMSLKGIACAWGTFILSYFIFTSGSVEDDGPLAEDIYQSSKTCADDGYSGTQEFAIAVYSKQGNERTLKLAEEFVEAVRLSVENMFETADIPRYLVAVSIKDETHKYAATLSDKTDNILFHGHVEEYQKLLLEAVDMSREEYAEWMMYHANFRANVSSTSEALQQSIVDQNPGFDVDVTWFSEFSYELCEINSYSDFVPKS